MPFASGYVASDKELRDVSTYALKPRSYFLRQERLQMALENLRENEEVSARYKADIANNEAHRKELQVRFLPHAINRTLLQLTVYKAP
jgi:hypothetical protein